MYQSIPHVDHELVHLVYQKFDAEKYLLPAINQLLYEIVKKSILSRFSKSIVK